MKKIIIALLLLPCISHAQEGFTTQSLSVFKNGQSFIIKEGKITASDNVYKISMLPNALFGTYWFNGISHPITMITSRVEKFTEQQERKANSFLELLHANKGKKITIFTSESRTFTGTVEDFDLPEEINSRLQLQQLDLSSNYSGISFDRIFPGSNPVILLKLEGKWISIEPSTIRSIEFTEKPNRTTTANIAVQKPIVSLHFNQNGAQTIQMMYLQNGISWTPTYKLQLHSETEASISLQAEVSNDIEDIKNTDIDFVVGVPNFSHATGLATLLNYTSAKAYSTPDMYSNIYQYAAKDTRAEQAVVREDAADYNPNIQSSENEDLYYYTVKNLTLNKNSRAQFPIFSYPVKIKHYYKGTLPLSTYTNYSLNNSEDYAEQSDNDEANATMIKNGQVAHYIDILNNTSNPFTSGPVLITQGGSNKAIAQSLLAFTGKGTTTPLFITNSPDIIVKELERVTGVSKNIKKINGYDYSLITITSTVTITNTKSKPVDIRLDKQIYGKATGASIKYRAANVVNNNSGQANSPQQLFFETDVAAGKKLNFTYTYQMYVR